MTTLRLDEITLGFAAVDAAFEQNDGEITPELAEQLEALNIAEGEKLDGYALYVQAQESEAVAHDAKREHYRRLADECGARRDAIKRRIAWLKQRVQNHMESRQVTELRGDIFRFKVCNNGGADPVVILVPLEDLPREYVEVEYKAKRDALRQGIKAGQVPETVAKLGERGTQLRIY